MFDTRDNVFAVEYKVAFGNECIKASSLYYVLFESCLLFLCPAAALIRGNRNNCTQFSKNLDWLVSKLERLESSSGVLIIKVTHAELPVRTDCEIS